MPPERKIAKNTAKSLTSVSTVFSATKRSAADNGPKRERKRNGNARETDSGTFSEGLSLLDFKEYTRPPIAVDVSSDIGQQLIVN